jgi:hypothetical protein
MSAAQARASRMVDLPVPFSTISIVTGVSKCNSFSDWSNGKEKDKGTFIGQWANLDGL